MAQYPIPQDTREKEKIIGGIFTMTQFAFVAIGVALGLLLGLGAYSLTNSLTLTIIVIVLIIGLFAPFGFVTLPRYGDIELYQYVIMLIKYKKSNKDFLNISENCRGGN